MPPPSGSVGDPEVQPDLVPSDEEVGVRDVEVVDASRYLGDLGGVAHSGREYRAVEPPQANMSGRKAVLGPATVRI